MKHSKKTIVATTYTISKREIIEKVDKLYSMYQRSLITLDHVFGYLNACNDYGLLDNEEVQEIVKFICEND